MKETTEHRAVEIAAWVLQKMGACTRGPAAEKLTCWLDGPDQTCRECIRDWLMDKAEQELRTERETR